jgi:serine protease
VGGSDVDNDGFICDIGETCGSYPVLNEQFVLDVTGSRTDIDFTSSVISGVTTNRASAIAGRPVDGFKLLPDTDRTHKAVSRR